MVIQIIESSREKTKKIIEAVKLSLMKKKSVADRAITYHVLAKEYGWTIDEIDNSPAVEVTEVLIVRDVIAKFKPPKKKVKRKR